MSDDFIPSGKWQFAGALALLAGRIWLAKSRKAEAPWVHKEILMTEKLGIQQTKEAVALVLSLVSAVTDAQKDGKIDLADLGLLLGVLPKISPALDGLAQIPGELTDLSTEEANELVGMVMGQLAIADPHARDVIAKALKVGTSGYELVVALKAKA